MSYMDMAYKCTTINTLSTLDSAQVHTPLSSQGGGGDIGPGSPGFWLAGMILRKSRSHLSMNTYENDVQGGIYLKDKLGRIYCKRFVYARLPT